MHQYLAPLISSFQQNANPEYAAPMQKYMKNRFDFLGIKRPLRNDLQKLFFKEYNLPDIAEISQIINELWELPEREFQYFALDLLVKMIKKLPIESIEIFERMIIERSWWDTVDLIAGKLVSIHFQRFPELRDKYIAKWMPSGNMWLQRTCLLFQLHYKDHTDVMLLGSIIMSLAKSDEFFIQKAIGWALREYSKTDAQAVINFVENNELPKLSKQEALKWLKNQGKY
ncbi:MAG: DNA alkylation repair protein [Candidatus Cloacimonetes bacterium]|nr:DNA alkylation repair protein [Candidatus Cloacimonadota bacterium]